VIYMYRVLKLSVNQHLETNDGKTAVIMSISEKNNADKIVNRDHSKWMLLDRTCIIIKAISSNWLVLTPFWFYAYLTHNFQRILRSILLSRQIYTFDEKITEGNITQQMGISSNKRLL